MTARTKFAVRCKGAWFAGPRGGWSRDKRARKLYKERGAAIDAARRDMGATDGVVYPELEIVELQRIDLVLWVE